MMALAEPPHPGNCQLGWGAALLLGESLDLLDELEVVLEGLGLEAWHDRDDAQRLELGSVLEPTRKHL